MDSDFKDTLVFGVLFIMLAIFLTAIVGSIRGCGYDAGYEWGQRDALHGKQQWQAATAPDGTLHDVRKEGTEK